MGWLADVADFQLVDCYASELACAGGLSESVSYGWALDAFLADPTEFRARVRLVRPALRADHTDCELERVVLEVDSYDDDANKDDDDDDDEELSTVESLLQPASKTVSNCLPPFSLARRGFSSKYHGVNWHKRDSKWQARIHLLEITLGYYVSEDDAARAHDKYVQEHNLNLPVNARADGVLIARESSSVYQGVDARESPGGKMTFDAFVHDNVNGKRKKVNIGRFDDETHAAIAHDAFTRTLPPTARTRKVNFLTFDEQIQLKLPRPFLIEIVRKMNKSGLRWETATVIKCKTDNSAHAEEHSACLLYNLEFEGDSASSRWDSLIPTDPSSCVFARRQSKVAKKVATSRTMAKDPKVSAPPASRDQGWWKRFKM